MYYCGFSYSDAYNLPIPQRVWFINRLTKEMSGDGDEGSERADKRHVNDPSLRAMLGSSHPQAPHNLKRM